MGMYVGGEIADLAAIGPAVDRGRDGRPAGPPVADRDARGGRAGEGRAARGAAAGRHGRSSTPTTRSSPGWTDRTAARALRYGFAETADVRADEVASAGVDGMRFRLRDAGGRAAGRDPDAGRLSVHNALAGAAVGLAAGLALDAIVAALAGGWAAPHRVEVVRLRGATVIDDSYNASPGSVIAALDLLAGLPGRHVAVLGEMLELGEGHEAGHWRSARPRAGRSSCSSSSGPRRAASSTGRMAAGLDAVAHPPRRRRRRGARCPSAAPARRRRGPRQGLARHRARPAWSTPCGSSSGKRAR